MIALPKAITFDCYGTLIDWESGIQQFFAERLAAHRQGAKAARGGRPAELDVCVSLQTRSPGSPKKFRSPHISAAIPFTR